MTAAVKVVESSEPAFSGESVNRPRVLAIDASLTCTGICLDGACSTLVPPKGCLGIPRLRWIREHVLNFCTDLVTEVPNVDLAVIEGLSFNSKSAYAHEIGGLGYLIRVALTDYGVTWAEIPPANLKMFATGKGSAKKEVVLVDARERWGYQGYDHNEADALILYRMAVAHYTGTATNEKQRDALKKIAWPTIGEPL